MSDIKAKVESNHTISMFKKYRNLLGELTRKSIKLNYTTITFFHKIRLLIIGAVLYYFSI